MNEIRVNRSMRNPWMPIEIPHRDPDDSPVLFLDVDGVLIGYGEEMLQGEPESLFSSVAVGECNRILKRTGAKIVLSTSWRFDEGWIEELLTCGVNFDGNLIGTTGVWRETRGQEIHEWLEEHGWPRRFVALDDDPSGMELIGDAFIQTNYRLGLTRQIADEAIARLHPVAVKR